jgi:predicted nucleotidyltransferase
MSPAAAKRIGLGTLEFNRLAAANAGYRLAVMQTETSFDELLDTLKRSSAALRDAGVPFVLGGGVAIWARGGPETEHDLDYFIKPDDAERALQVLAEAGLRPEKPPEGWLYKAWDDHVLVDLIFDPTGVTVDDAFIEGAEESEVHAVRMRVLRSEDVLVTKLLALKEHSLDYDGLLEIARAVREQIDWDEVRRRTEESPYAKAFLTLVDELEVSS